MSVGIKERDIKELFTHETENASKLYDFTIVIGSILLAIGMSIYFKDAISVVFNGTITYELFIGLILSVPLGTMVGFFWVFITKLFMKLFFVNPVKAVNDDKADLLQISGILSKALYSENLENAYLQLHTPDSNYKSFFSMLRFSSGFILSFLAIFYFVLYYILDLFPSHNTNAITFIGFILVSSIIALLVVGIYQPIRLVTDDSRVLIQNYDGTFGQASIDIYDYINRFLVVTGLLTGINLLTRELKVRNIEADLFNTVLLYLIFSIVVLIIISPAIFPAMLIYRNSHSNIVNSLRKELADNGLQIIKINRKATFQVLDEDDRKYVLGSDINENEVKSN